MFYYISLSHSINKSEFYLFLILFFFTLFVVLSVNNVVIMFPLLVLVIISTIAFEVKNVYAVQIDRDVFGQIIDEKNSSRVIKIFQYTMKTKECTVQIITYGATIRSITVPDKFGNFDDIVLGFDDLNGYLSKENPYFGSTIGRVANRIANASYTLDGVTYHLDKNEGNNTLHGGFRGFDKEIYNAFVVDDELVMFGLSPDGEGGFPGTVKTYLIFNLTSNRLIIKYFTRTDKRTPINLTNHAYFNLAGQTSRYNAIFNHTIEINADRYTVLDNQSIPTGEIRYVTGSQYDLRKQQSLGAAIHSTGLAGYDINYVLNKVDTLDSPTPQFAARVMHPPSGRYVTMCTDQPGIQFYTANGLSDVRGKFGTTYRKFGAFCLEAQKFPDAVHHENFPSTILNPLESYEQITTYQFGIM